MSHFDQEGRKDPKREKGSCQAMLVQLSYEVRGRRNSGIPSMLPTELDKTKQCKGLLLWMCATGIFAADTGSDTELCFMREAATVARSLGLETLTRCVGITRDISSCTHCRRLTLGDSASSSTTEHMMIEPISVFA